MKTTTTRAPVWVHAAALIAVACGDDSGSDETVGVERVQIQLDGARAPPAYATMAA